MVLGNFLAPPATIVDGSVHLPVGFLEMHPGASGQYSAVRFVAPSSGTYGFAGQFQGQDSGGTSTDVHILRIAAATSTSTSLFASAVNGFYAGSPPAIVPFNLADVALAAGDSVLFVVGDGGGTYYADSTGLQVTASFAASAGSPAADDPFGYLGGLGYWQDPALDGSGLQYVRQRWLENATGQWLSVDPVATEPRYGYVHNSPTMRVDPSGTAPSLISYFDGLLDDTRAISQNFRAINKLMIFGVQRAQEIYRELLIIQQAANSKWEQERRSLPAFLSNIAPPAPFVNPVGMVEWEAGLIWGVIGGLFGMLPIIGWLPTVVDFIKYLFQNGVHLSSILDYGKSQISGIKMLFTEHLDLSPFQRGEIFGNLLATVVVVIVGLIATAGAGAALLFEGGVQNLFKNAARLGSEAAQSARQAIREIPSIVLTKGRNLATEASTASRAIGAGKLPPRLQGHVENLQRLFNEANIDPKELPTRASKHIETEVGVSLASRKARFNSLNDLPQRLRIIVRYLQEVELGDTSQVNLAKYEMYKTYLERRNIKFEVGTARAKQVLAEQDAFGLYRPLGGPDSGTLFLPELEHVTESTFYEEAIHALQDLRDTRRTGKTFYERATSGEADLNTIIQEWESEVAEILVRKRHRLSSMAERMVNYNRASRMRIGLSPNIDFSKP